MNCAATTWGTTLEGKYGDDSFRLTKSQLKILPKRQQLPAPPSGNDTISLWEIPLSSLGVSGLSAARPESLVGILYGVSVLGVAVPLHGLIPMD